jgi:Putative methyltransferase
MYAVLLANNFQRGFSSEQPWLHLILIQWPISLAPALFTFLLSGLLGYARGGMAWVGAAIAAVFTILLPFQQVSAPLAEWYPRLHPWLFGIFYIYALAGLALCGVGIYDGKRSAIWALLAVLSLLGGALADTVNWFGWASSSPWVPIGFIGFWVCLVVGFLRRPADAPMKPDVQQAARNLANNRTRRSRSLARKLLREGNIHLLPLYYLFNLSDLGREGIENSGSYRFADHIYRNQASGRGLIGRWIDARMLASAPSQAFRRRYLRCVQEMRRALESFPAETRPLRVLAIPCGLPRDVKGLAAELQKDNPALLQRIEYHGMDVDADLLRLAEEFTANVPLPVKQYHQGNALLAETFLPGPFHFVASTGLNEFLEEPQLEVFYRNVYDRLAPGGTFYTSCTQKERRSEVVMRAFELVTRYHTPEELKQLLGKLPWSRVDLTQDETGLQTFVVAVK